MTGADFAGIKKEFFADNAEIPFLIVNIGHGEAPAYPAVYALATMRLLAL